MKKIAIIAYGPSVKQTWPHAFGYDATISVNGTSNLFPAWRPTWDCWGDWCARTFHGTDGIIIPRHIIDEHAAELKSLSIRSNSRIITWDSIEQIIPGQPVETWYTSCAALAIAGLELGGTMIDLYGHDRGGTTAAIDSTNHPTWSPNWSNAWNDDRWKREINQHNRVASFLIPRGIIINNIQPKTGKE